MDGSKSCQLQSRLSYNWNSFLCVSKVPQSSFSTFSPFKARTLYIKLCFPRPEYFLGNFQSTQCRCEEPRFWKPSHVGTGEAWVRYLRKHWWHQIFPWWVGRSVICPLIPTSLFLFPIMFYSQKEFWGQSSLLTQWVFSVNIYFSSSSLPKTYSLQKL